MRPTLVALSIGVLVAATGCGGHDTPVSSGKLEPISSVRQFERAFNHEQGHPRLVLLLSPT